MLFRERNLNTDCLEEESTSAVARERASGGVFKTFFCFFYLILMLHLVALSSSSLVPSLCLTVVGLDLIGQGMTYDHLSLLGPHQTTSIK